MKKVIVIGAGPAGLTAAYEILNRTDSCQVLVLEEKNQIGGLAKTVDFQDYRMDLGGHRFLMVNEKVLESIFAFKRSKLYQAYVSEKTKIKTVL